MLNGFRGILPHTPYLILHTPNSTNFCFLYLDTQTTGPLSVYIYVSKPMLLGYIVLRNDE